MDILSVVNSLQPGTIKRLGRKAEDFPADSVATPFMGVFVEVAQGRVLPSEAAVTAHESVYLAAQAALADIGNNAVLDEQLRALALQDLADKHIAELERTGTAAQKTKIAELKSKKR